ncbi:MAG: FAD-binding protein [bacterium]|nr:FAD-binding protein [bacterium]
MTQVTERQRRTLLSSGCDVRFDQMTRLLFATDASIYRVEPAAVAFPRSAYEVSALLFSAQEAGIEITPRGAGTGLAGGALGSGLVVELARHNRQIGMLDRDTASVQVGAGVVLDQLNTALRPHGVWFGPDVATSSRATLGGMIANNSSGAHAPVYGTTLDHIEALEIVLADGTVTWVGEDHHQLAHLAEAADALIQPHAAAIRDRCKTQLIKRRPGYGLDRWLAQPGELSQLVGGSEGTLAVVTSAVVRVVPIPPRRELGVLFFDSLEEAMSATVEVFDLGPAAVEHIDHHVFEQTRGQPAFVAARQLLMLDEQPCASLLLVEFFEDDGADKLQRLATRSTGIRTHLCRDAMERELVWSLRRAGLSLLTACKGPAKPVAGIEDVCVQPERLPEYVAELRKVIDPLGIEASYYGHAGSGELHVRPKLDLHRAEDVAKLRLVADQVSRLCIEFNGSLAGEHGVGIARTEFLKDQIGCDLVELSASIKNLFDPQGKMNPGKIIDTGRYRIDGDLRLGPGSTIDLSFQQQLGYIERDESFVGNLEQCNGCGGCRKDPPTMCPTFKATGDEALSTRGRANIIRAALDGHLDWRGSPVLAAGVEEVLTTCLSCKACKHECPSNVDLALLKAELRNARHRLSGPSLLDRVVASSDVLGRIGTIWPEIANRSIKARWIRVLLQRVLGLNADRSLLPFAEQRFDRWFVARDTLESEALKQRGVVFLWDDTWTRYHEPGPGHAATHVLERLGYEVRLIQGRKCCGRPAFSRGLLTKVRRLAEHNLQELANAGSEPLLFLEPSCYSMFVDEYRQLRIPGAGPVADRCHLFEDFVLERHGQSDGAFASGADTHVVVHAHCHAKALASPASTVDRLDGIAGVEAQNLDTGCCGMAGAFGLERHNEALSRAVAQPLLEMLDGLDPETQVVAGGTSCRHQIRDHRGLQALHPAELLESLQLQRPRTNSEESA